MSLRDIIQDAIVAVEDWVDEANSWLSSRCKLFIDLKISVCVWLPD